MSAPVAPPRDPLSSDSPPSPNFRRRLALLIAALVALRLAYLAQSLSLPLLATPLYDSEVYLHQAQAIRAGQFGDASLLAFSPLYGWLLALLAGSVATAIALQLALGIALVIAIAEVARRRAGDGAGLSCAVLFGGYGLPLFYETKILSETLGLALALGGLAVLLATGRSERAEREMGSRRRIGVGLIAGALLGLSVLARASLLFTLPLYPLAALLPWSEGERRECAWRRAARALAVGGGIALVLAANGLWNRAHAGRFVPVVMVSRTAAVATRSEWNGDFRVFAAGHDVSPWDVVDQAEQELRGGPSTEEKTARRIDVGGWLRNAPPKLARTLVDRETTFDYGYYGERSELWILRALPVSFGLLELWAALGVVALFARGVARRAWPLVPLVAGTLCTTTLFYPTSRYRLPMALALALLGAECAPAIFALPLVRRRIAIALLAIASLACAARTIARVPERPAEWELRVAEAAVRAGDVDEAVHRIERARELAPNDPEVAHRIELITSPPRRR